MTKQINYPAASSGVLEERKLATLVQLAVLISLLLDILSYYVLVSMLPYGAGEIPIRPKFTAPQLFLDLRTSPENLPCTQALDDRHHLRHRIARNTLHKKMNMILISPYLDKLDLITLFNFHANLFENLVHFSIEYRTPVLRWKH